MNQISSTLMGKEEYDKIEVLYFEQGLTYIEVERESQGLTQKYLHPGLD